MCGDGLREGISDIYAPHSCVHTPFKFYPPTQPATEETFLMQVEQDSRTSLGWMVQITFLEQKEASAAHLKKSFNGLSEEHRNTPPDDLGLSGNPTLIRLRTTAKRPKD